MGTMGAKINNTLTAHCSMAKVGELLGKIMRMSQNWLVAVGTYLTSKSHPKGA